MRRRLALLLVSTLSLGILAFGLAVGASAKGDALSAVRSLTAKYQSVQAAEKATQPTGSVHFMKPRRLTVGSASAGFFSSEALIPGPTVLDRGVGLTVGGGPPGVMGVMGG